MSTTCPIVAGIIGFGRSGCNIHAATLAMLPEKFKIGAIFDAGSERRAEAQSRFGAVPCSTIDELLARPEVELIIVASPNAFHARQTIAALNAGKHVLSEKPFGFTTADVDAMIAASKKNKRVLQAYQQRRFERDFQKVKEVLASGIIGKPTFIRICWHGFGRRWDWQTSRLLGGGQLYNNGPHPVDHALELFGPAEPNVRCELRRSMCSGDAEDEVRITLSAPDSPTIDIEILATAAYPHDRWWVSGTSGGLRGGVSRLDWKWVDFSKMPERSLELKPTEGRTYNSEQLDWQEAFWTAPTKTDAGAGAPPDFVPGVTLYSHLHDVIRNGVPQIIPPEAIRRRIAVLEKCYRQCGISFPEGTLDI